MVQVAIPYGLWWPFGSYFPNYTIVGTYLLNVTNERVAFTGHVYIEGRATSKTISTGGSVGKLHFNTPASTWANGATTVTAGIQDTSTSGPPARGDGTFDVQGDIVGGDANIVNGWSAIPMTSGSKVLSHGQLVTVLIQMTNRAGADNININMPALGESRPRVTSSQDGVTWANEVFKANIGITFDDGTLGFIAGGFPMFNTGSSVYSNSSNPDEFGLGFQVPFDCYIDAFHARVASADANADWTITLYTDPYGTPAAVSGGQVVVLAEQGISTANAPSDLELAAPLFLSKNTDYLLAVKADSTGLVTLTPFVPISAAWRIFLPGSTTLQRGQRNNGSGAFGSLSTAILPHLGVKISSVDDGTGVATPGGVHILGGGLIR